MTPHPTPTLLQFNPQGEDSERCISALRSALHDAKLGQLKQLMVVAVDFKGAGVFYRALSGKDIEMVGALTSATIHLHDRKEVELVEQSPEDEGDD